MAFQPKPSASSESDAPEPSASTSSSESRLLERVRRGSRGASEALFGRYGAWLRRWTRGRLPERVRGSLDTSDVVQETLGYMFARLEWFESKRAKALRAYLRRVAENRIRDELRRAVRRHGAIAPAQPVRASEDGAPHELGYNYRQLALVEPLPSTDAARMALRRALIRLGEVMPDP